MADRTNDEELAPSARPQREPLPNSTLADRAKARRPRAKAVQTAENKAVSADKPARKSKS